MENPEIIKDVQNSSTTNPAIKWGWLRALIQLIVWFIVNLLISGIATVAVVIIQGQDPATLMGDQAGIIEKVGIIGMTIISFFGLSGTLLTVWLFRRFIDKKSIQSLGFEFKGYRNDLFAGMGWGFLLILIGFAALWISGMLKVTSVQFNPLSIFFYLLMFIIVAFNEEILVRGYILINLMDSMNKYIALIVSSLLFSAMHLMNANMSVVPAINIFLAGILLGIYFVHKGNLWFPIGMHLTWNFFQGPVFGFEVSGQITNSIIVQDINGHELLTGGEFGFEGSLIATVAMIILIVVIHFKHKKNDVA
jgi:membrane protease YdiL (CAAX protease family)